MQFYFSQFHQRGNLSYLWPDESPAEELEVHYYLHEAQKLDSLKSLFDPESVKLEGGRSLDESIDQLIRLKFIEVVHPLVNKWFDLLKKGQYLPLFHLSRFSPTELYQQLNLDPVQNTRIDVGISYNLLSMVIKEREARLHIPEEEFLIPESELIRGLDVKMNYWAKGFPELQKNIATVWVEYLVKLRRIGMSHIHYLEKGVKVVGSSRTIRNNLQKIFMEVLDLLESSEAHMYFLQEVLKLYKSLPERYGPKLMLHAIGAEIQKRKLTQLYADWKQFNSPYPYMDDYQDYPCVELFKIGLDLDLEEWLYNLTLPAFDQAPMLSGQLIRTIHKQLLKLSGSKNGLFELSDWLNEDESSSNLASISEEGLADFKMPRLKSRDHLTQVQRTKLLLEFFPI